VDGFGSSGGFLNFCPGSAATRSGDPLEIYPEALLRMDVTDEVVGKPKRKSLLPILP
jgi:hypothetical protein